MPYTEQLPHTGSAEVMFNGLFDEPAGTVARILPRGQCNNGALAGNATGTVQARGIPLPAGLTVSNIMVLSGTTAEVAGTHFWAGLTDLQSNVLAVTADQTGASYVTASTWLKNALVNAPFVVPQTGLYYVVVSISATTTMPTLSGATVAAGVLTGTGNPAPILIGTMGVQAAAPAIGAQLAAISTANGANFGAWLS